MRKERESERERERKREREREKGGERDKRTGTYGVVTIVVEKDHGDPSSNIRRGCENFTFH